MRTLFTCALLFVAFTLAGQDSVDEQMYQAYLSQSPAPEKWKSAIATRQSEAAGDSNTKARFKLALAQFGLLSSTMRNRDEDLFDEYYNETEELLEEIISKDKSWGEPYALLSATYGLKMGYSPMQGIFLGAKSNGLIEKAKKLSPASPLVWKVAANAKFFTPDMWGGDLEEAIQNYEACIKLYEADPASLKFNWLYINALAFQGQAYAKNSETAKAVATYEKALSVEPSFGWVRFSLLPKIQKAKNP